MAVAPARAGIDVSRFYFLSGSVFSWSVFSSGCLVRRRIEDTAYIAYKLLAASSSEEYCRDPSSAGRLAMQRCPMIRNISSLTDIERTRADTYAGRGQRDVALHAHGLPFE